MSNRLTATSLDFVTPNLPAARRSGFVKGFVGWVTDMPRRRAVLNELESLSDHELSDIGLNRSDLPRVFDPAFTAGR